MSIRQLIQGHAVGKWHSQGLNPGPKAAVVAVGLYHSLGSVNMALKCRRHCVRVQQTVLSTQHARRNPSLREEVTCSRSLSRKQQGRIHTMLLTQGSIGASGHAWSRFALSHEEPMLGEVSDHSGPGQREVYLNRGSFAWSLGDREDVNPGRGVGRPF